MLLFQIKTAHTPCKESLQTLGHMDVPCDGGFFFFLLVFFFFNLKIHQLRCSMEKALDLFQKFQYFPLI